MDDLLINSGKCFVFLAYDVGNSINLDVAASLIPATVQRPQLGDNKRQPRYFGYDPRPVRFTYKIKSCEVINFFTAEELEITLWDFGAITVGYRIDFKAELAPAELIKLSSFLDESELLDNETSNLLTLLLEELKPAIQNPALADTIEQYVVFQIDELNKSISGSELLKQNLAKDIAKIARGETVQLSKMLIKDTLKYNCSYRSNDLGENSDIVIIGWNAALIYGESNEESKEDLRAVLEFITVQLLQTQLLDKKLDNYLDEAYRVSSQNNLNFRNYLSRIGALQVDAAMVFEAVNNAVKLVGDEFLAQVHDLAVMRFDLPKLNVSIERKLSILQSIYEKLIDRRTHLRSELLELAIVFLILIEIILNFI